jgi:hypothetical protein
LVPQSVQLSVMMWGKRSVMLSAQQLVQPSVPALLIQSEQLSIVLQAHHLMPQSAQMSVLTLGASPVSGPHR